LTITVSLQYLYGPITYVHNDLGGLQEGAFVSYSRKYHTS